MGDLPFIYGIDGIKCTFTEILVVVCTPVICLWAFLVILMEFRVKGNEYDKKTGKSWNIIAVDWSAAVGISRMLHCGKNGRKNQSAVRADQGSVILATSGEPTRYYALSDEGCAGDDNLVLSNVYDCLTFLEADGVDLRRIGTQLGTFGRWEMLYLPSPQRSQISQWI